MKGNVTVVGQGANDAPFPAATNKKGFFKNCAPFTDCISEINNTKIDNAKDLDIVMPMCNLVEYSDNYLKTSGCLWQCSRDEPDVNIINFE